MKKFVLFLSCFAFCFLYNQMVNAQTTGGSFYGGTSRTGNLLRTRRFILPVASTAGILRMKIIA